MREDALLSPLTNAGGVQQELEIYRNTQREWLKSAFVLVTALRKPEIGKLAVVQREKPNEIVWLQDHLEVSFPGNAEIMQVSLAADDPEEAATLLRAVVDAYLGETVGRE
jgi:hypothetical protein